MSRLYTTGWEDYELLDAGGGRKLERWGKIITIRPEIQAYFKSGLEFSEWYKVAHWEFRQGKGQTGTWKSINPAADRWSIRYGSLHFNLQLTQFKHVGLFPEQRINWDFMAERINSEDRFLNLFAYTGAMSCVARNRGADTYHVDSVRQMLTWAATNMESSRLLNIRWVHEDALRFLDRLVKRGERFDGIVMDPPAWGSGANKEKWKLEDQIDHLIASSSKVLTEEGSLVLNTYSPKVDLTLLNELADLYFTDRSPEVRELWMKTKTDKDLYYGNLLRIG